MKNKTQLAPLFTRVETLHVTSLQLARMALGVVAGMGVASSLLPQPVLADPYYDHPIQEFKKDQQNQDLYSPSNGSNFNVFNLLHQAQQGGPLRDLNDFNREQGQNIDSAVAKFRLQQQQLLRNQNQATPAAIPVMPSSSVQK